MRACARLALILAVVIGGLTVTKPRVALACSGNAVQGAVAIVAGRVTSSESRADAPGLRATMQPPARVTVAVDEYIVGRGPVLLSVANPPGPCAAGPGSFGPYVVRALTAPSAGGEPLILSIGTVAVGESAADPVVVSALATLRARLAAGVFTPRPATVGHGVADEARPSLALRLALLGAALAFAFGARAGTGMVARGQPSVAGAHLALPGGGARSYHRCREPGGVA